MGNSHAAPGDASSRLTRFRMKCTETLAGGHPAWESDCPSMPARTEEWLACVAAVVHQMGPAMMDSLTRS